jgi:hypothetical protein
MAGSNDFSMMVRNSRSPMWTGDVFNPLSGDPWATKCFGSAMTE